MPQPLRMMMVPWVLMAWAALHSTCGELPDGGEFFRLRQLVLGFFQTPVGLLELQQVVAQGLFGLFECAAVFDQVTQQCGAALVAAEEEAVSGADNAHRRIVKNGPVCKQFMLAVCVAGSVHACISAPPCGHDARQARSVQGSADR